MASLFAASVGLGGVNRVADVLLAQKLLNAVPYQKGGPMPLLACDGVCGPKTAGGIKRFQQTNLGFGDARIDPGLNTEQVLVAILTLLGLLARLLEDKPSLPKPETPPAQPPLPAPAGDDTPIRLRFLTILKELLPAKGLTAGSAPTGPKATACGELPGRVFLRVPVLQPWQPGAFKINVKSKGGAKALLYLTSPTTWWEEMAQAIDAGYPTAQSWVPFKGTNRPRPGDIYLLGKFDDRDRFQHVGIFVGAVGNEWTTADAGQGNGWQSGFVKRKFQATGQIDGEFGSQAWLRGWVDIDQVAAVAMAAFPKNLVGAG